MTRRAAAATAALLALSALTGCSDSTAGLARPALVLPSPVVEGPAVGPQYVALGDSYAAAPGVPETSGVDGCFRSSGNYAQRLAAATGLTVTDVTCSGATSADVLERQVPAITPEAELVTVGIGGNDFDLFATLVQSCLSAPPPESDPSGTPCTDAVGPTVDEVLPRTAQAVQELFAAIDEAAPGARVVVVGYPYLLPDSGTCPELVPLAAGDYPLVNEATRRLSGVLRDAAAQQGFDFVDVQGPSRGHDICSDEPWINGQQVAEDGTIPFHPFAAEQQAVAELVASVL